MYCCNSSVQIYLYTCLCAFYLRRRNSVEWLVIMSMPPSAVSVDNAARCAAPRTWPKSSGVPLYADGLRRQRIGGDNNNNATRVVRDAARRGAFPLDRSHIAMLRPYTKRAGGESANSEIVSRTLRGLQRLID